MVFFVKDRNDSNNTTITYCSTEHMLKDLFMKYFQRSLFMKFHDVIMGWKHIYTLQMGPPSIKDHVGNEDEVLSSIKSTKKDMREKHLYADILIGEKTRVTNILDMGRYNVSADVSVITDKK